MRLRIKKPQRNPGALEHLRVMPLLMLNERRTARINRDRHRRRLGQAQRPHDVRILFGQGRIADLGAGWGYLSAAILKNAAVRDLHVVEAEADALDCARVNLTDARAQFHWADATTWKAPTALDAVVMNPPFHVGRDADPALGIAFLGAAARLLHPQGVLWLVANRHLPYDRPLATLFRDVSDVGGDNGFRVIRASHSIRPR